MCIRDSRPAAQISAMALAFPPARPFDGTTLSGFVDRDAEDAVARDLLRAEFPADRERLILAGFDGFGRLMRIECCEGGIDGRCTIAPVSYTHLDVYKRQLLGRLYQLVEFGAQRIMLRVVPLAERNQMLLQARDRIAERPGARFLCRAIGARVVRGAVPFGAIGEMFDQRRTVIRPRPVSRPLRRGIDGKRVIAVDAQAGDCLLYTSRCV